jgi:hypothetical protein
MGFRTMRHAVAACGLARDHSRSQLPFSLVVGRIQFVHVQEAQQMLSMFAQPLGEAGVVRVVNRRSPWMSRSNRASNAAAR